MRYALTRAFLVVVVALFASAASSQAVVLFTYDFPGNPGSGLAANQTNGQPSNATFGDFTRTGGVTSVGGGSGTSTFYTSNWNQTGSIDTAQYEGFSISAAGGYHLNLTSLAFDLNRDATGPANFEVDLFLNGSATAYATFSVSPTTTLTTYTFDFTDLTDSDNATSAEFRFYGWNAGGAGGKLLLDNVVTSGAVSSAPEPATAWFALLPLGLAAYSLGTARQRRIAKSAGISQKSPPIDRGERRR